MAENKALIVNCLGIQALTHFQRIVQEFCGDSECSGHDTFIWSVENKYYKTRILLQYSHLNEEGKIDVKVENYEALVLVYNSNQQFQVDDIWKMLMKQLSKDGEDFEAPPICVLVAVVEDLGQTEALESTLKWCVDNGFEMIEWSSKEDSSNSQEGKMGKTESGSLLDDIETSGSARLAEALEAHMWPDMTMKSTSGIPEVDATKATEVPNVDTPAATAVLSENERMLAKGIDGGNDEGESFEEMFARFAEMKAHAEQLPRDQRKQYAEKVVMAFWEAIGGDEDEMKEDIT